MLGRLRRVLGMLIAKVRRAIQHEPMKRCSRCGSLKKLSDFGKHRSRPDGLQDWCRDCKAAYRRTYQETGGSHGRVLSPADVQQVRLWAAHGMPDAQIARLFSVPRQIVRQARSGITGGPEGSVRRFRKGSEVWPHREQILSLYKEGHSISEIARMFGVTRPAISKVLKRLRTHG